MIMWKKQNEGAPETRYDGAKRTFDFCPPYFTSSECSTNEYQIKKNLMPIKSLILFKKSLKR